MQITQLTLQVAYVTDVLSADSRQLLPGNQADAEHAGQRKFSCSRYNVDYTPRLETKTNTAIRRFGYASINTANLMQRQNTYFCCLKQSGT